jgi:hypothetical protein
MTERVSGDVQPWLLLGERRRRGLEDRARAAAERWSTRWIASPVSVSIAIEPARSRAMERGDRKTSCFGARRHSREWVAVALVPRRVAAWAAGLGAVALSATPEPGDESLAAEVELELLRGLWSELVPALAAGDAPLERLDAAGAGTASAALEKRGVRVACVFGPTPGLCIQWTLSAAAAAMMLAEPAVAFAGEPLTSRRTALSQTAVGLDCHLGSIQVPVRDLHSLRTGDVLLTDVTLESRAELRVRNGSTAIAVGAIGESDGRRAIKIESANRRSNR